MMPAAPPLPVPRNLPFHVAVGGSQTSIRMCDSGVGVSVAAMRQNSGVFIGVPLALAPGARNVPAYTSTAAVIVAAGSLSAPSASQELEVWAAAGAAMHNTIAKCSAKVLRCSAKALAERPITAVPRGR